ncbi:MAG TPA: AraC family transcriptional regulator [Balneolales bacterium]|nr:AraC family transcriptional regulator [Balneolales bacterium]
MEKSNSDRSGKFRYYEDFVSVNDLCTTELVEESRTIPLPYGSMDMKHWLFDGIRVGYRRVSYSGQYDFYKDNNLDVVNLSFNLKGSVIIHHAGQEYRVAGRQHNIVYSPGVGNTFKNGDLETEVFEIQFIPDVFMRMAEDGNDTLKRFLQQMQTGDPAVLGRQSLTLNLELQETIHEVLNCRFTGSMKKLFLLSKSIEILVLQAEAYDRAAKEQPICCKRKDDQDRIRYARDYVVDHIDNPPSLSNLARIVGINEYKLKRGFKEVFHATVFGYLSDYRLNMARHSLIEGSKTVSEIAYDLGYSSPQHFSTSFKKRFGVSPSSVRK